MGKDVKKSSYDRVNELLMATPEWHNAVATVKEHFMRGPTSVSVDYRLESPDKGVNAVYRAKYLVGPGDEREVSSYDVFKASFDVYQIPREILDGIFSSCFGKPVVPGRKRLKVPTFNCKEDKARDEFRKMRHEFFDAVRESAQFLQKSIIQAWSEIPGTEIAEGKEAAFRAAAVKEIQAILMRWGERVPAAVVKEALDGYVVHAIMEA